LAYFHVPIMQRKEGSRREKGEGEEGEGERRERREREGKYIPYFKLLQQF
jgi:hypothetical protein